MNFPGRAWALVALVGLLAASCGGSSLSPEASEGREVATQAGCMSCHGGEGQGGAGPSWVNLFEGQVELSDGTSVIADQEYLVRSILDPDAQSVATYTLKMPTNSVSTVEAEQIVAYIKELK